MKKKVLYPNFEFVFSAGIIAMLVLPRIVVAQQPEKFKIGISDGDMLINDKNRNVLSADERNEALRYFKKLSDSTMKLTAKKPAVQR